MTRKGLLILALAAFVAGGVSAMEVPPLQFSVGGGLSFDYSRVLYWENFPGNIRHAGSLEHFGFGGWLFADATFAELAIAVQGGPGTWLLPQPFGEISASFVAMDFTLLGKFPFTFSGGSFSLFPLLGIGYNLVLSVSADDEAVLGTRLDSPGDFSAFRIKWGAGGDFNLSESLFIRASLLASFSFPPSVVSDFAHAQPVWTEYTGGFGATVRIGIGLRL